MNIDLLCYVTSLALVPALCGTDSITNSTMHSLGQDNQNEVQHDFFGHVTPLSPVSTSESANGSGICVM